MRAMEDIRSFHCPRWEELPSLPLYMDQVVLVLGETLHPLKMDGEDSITKSMINNYVKQRLMDPPLKKKYTREHLASLIIVGLLKRALSIPEIASLLHSIRMEYGVEAAYDRFCSELEDVLSSTYGQGQIRVAADGAAARVLRAALTAWAGKLLLQDLLVDVPSGGLDG